MLISSSCLSSRGLRPRLRGFLAQVVDELCERLAARPAAGPDAACRRLHLLDVHVRVERHVHEVVRAVAARQEPLAPVVRQARPGASVLPCTVSGGIRFVTSTRRLDRGARRVDRRPAAVLEPRLLRELGRHLAEHRRLQLGEVRHRARHAARGVVLGQPVRRHDVRKELDARLAGTGLYGSSSSSGHCCRAGFARCE